MSITNLMDRIRDCRLCAAQFAATETGHAPRPVPWLSDQARILIAGQAPGARVHASGLPFDDPSGERLRDWMGIDRGIFYDRSQIAILPMAFCFPGYKKGADLPPPPDCAKTWRETALAEMPQLRLSLLVGGYALRWHLGTKASVSEIVQNWRGAPAGTIPLPHPSWRNTGWLKKNTWFETELVPVLRKEVQKWLN